MQEAQNPLSLDGVTVIVTRARSQAVPLCEAVVASKGRVLQIPAIEISFREVDQKNLQLLTDVPDQRGRVVVFTSINAVNALKAAFAEDSARGASDTAPGVSHFPLNTLANVIAVGQATESCLAAHGIDALTPDVPSSDGILGMPLWQHCSAADVWIIGGVGGRQLLKNRLIERGFQVREMCVYSRQRPQVDLRPLLSVWRRADSVVVTLMSGETAENLVEMVKQCDKAALPLVFATPAVVVSNRVKEFVQSLGWQAAVVVASAPCPRAVSKAAAEISNI